MQHDSSSGLPGATTGSPTPPTTPGDALVARIANPSAAFKKTLIEPVLVQRGSTGERHGGSPSFAPAERELPVR